MDLAAGQVPEQPGVDGPEGQVVIDRHPAFAQQPLELGTGEIRVEHQTGGGAHQGEVTVGLQGLATGRGAPVLPHDGSVSGLAGAPIPGHDGLALVGDPDGGHRLAQGADQFGGGADDGVPDLGRIVLHPPGAGEVLGELAVAVADRLPLLVHGEGAHPGGARVEGDDDGHGRRPYAGGSVGSTRCASAS